MNLGFGKYKDQYIENVYLRDPQYLINILSVCNDRMTIEYVKNNVLSKPKKNLMNFERLMHSLKSYLKTPEIIIYDVLKGLLGNELIDHKNYDRLKKRWDTIKYYADDISNSINTYYQEFIYDLEKLINKNMNWYYELGRFPLPKNNYGIVCLSCLNTLATKIITVKVLPITIQLQKEALNTKVYVSGNNNETKIIIEDNTTINFNNIKKCIKICDTLHLLNGCKNCNKITINSEFCSDCTNNAAQKIQLQWKECISNPRYKICKKRLLLEFSQI